MGYYKIGDKVQIVNPLMEEDCEFGTNADMRRQAGRIAVIEGINGRAYYVSFDGKRSHWSWSEGCFRIPEEEATPEMEFSTEDFLNIIKGV